MKKLATIALLISSVVLTSAGINLNLLDNYASQPFPGYARRGGTPQDIKPISDAEATLGRVLFYDKKLSANNAISCGSCHHQQFAFGDTAVQSPGLHQEPTARHTMRLVNIRFGTEQTFFWDERAEGLESQVTQPVRNHLEMGFSGANGDPDIDSLIRKLQAVAYYNILFRLSFGDPLVTEARIQQALSHFVRSIQSFDAKYDSGRIKVPFDFFPFPNFSEQENLGKDLFFKAPVSGGAGCGTCHNGPLFDIDASAGNNNTTGVAGQPDSIDINVTRAPSLRDVVNPSGRLNAPLMHDGSITSLEALLDHYDVIVQDPANTRLDRELIGQNLHLDQTKRAALIAFLKTLSGHNLYTDKKWADPFDPDGTLNLTGLPASAPQQLPFDVALFPNPASGRINLRLPAGSYFLEVYDISGRRVAAQQIGAAHSLDLGALPDGLLQFHIRDLAGSRSVVKLVTKGR